MANQQMAIGCCMDRPNQPNYLDTQPERINRKQYKKKGEDDDDEEKANLSILDTFQGESIRKLKDKPQHNFEAFSSSASIYSRAQHL
jgi:hypothetical protein